MVMFQSRIEKFLHGLDTTIIEIQVSFTWRFVETNSSLYFGRQYKNDLFDFKTLVF